MGLPGCLLLNFFVGVYCVLPRACAGSPSGALSLGRGVSPWACVGWGRRAVLFRLGLMVSIGVAGLVMICLGDSGL